MSNLRYSKALHQRGGLTPGIFLATLSRQVDALEEREPNFLNRFYVVLDIYDDTHTRPDGTTVPVTVTELSFDVVEDLK